MCIVFVEYQIEESFQSDYLDWASALKQTDGRVDIYEGSEQPGLFVEIWKELDPGSYRRMKALRTGHPDEVVHGSGSAEEMNRWGALDPWVKGGRQKIHIWRFDRVI